MTDMHSNTPTIPAALCMSNLQPYQLIAVRISALTIAGEGPKSESASGFCIKVLCKFHTH